MAKKPKTIERVYEGPSPRRLLLGGVVVERGKPFTCDSELDLGPHFRDNSKTSSGPDTAADEKGE